jgi:hypothetical protein
MLVQVVAVAATDALVVLVSDLYLQYLKLY